MATPEWLYPYKFRRRLSDEGNEIGFIPSIPIDELGSDLYFTEQDGVTPLEVETSLIDKQLYLRLPTDKPVYVYYNR